MPLPGGDVWYSALQNLFDCGLLFKEYLMAVMTPEYTLGNTRREFYLSNYKLPNL